MAHRKLQQEVDRVFKKISEGLEIFDAYYERHENCTNNPSQKDKLECDLKREVKKLQRLREQIKSWQSAPEIKDKDSLLDNRRSVEVAMEKYKAVEKASKEKAYSNNSLKRSDNLDPQEKERRDVSEYLSLSIEELERQYDSVQVEVDRLILLNKKKKTATAANEERKNQLKDLQGRFRWHLQQMELALRLVENQELDPEDVKSIRDDINYYVESNMEPDFVEDETIYDNLNLTSNEAIAHEVAAAFAAQHNEELEEDAAKENSKLSKKEQRKVEREAKKAAKSSTKSGSPHVEHIPAPTGIVIPQRSETRHNEIQSEPASVSPSRSPSPDVSSAGTSIPATAHAKLPATLPSSTGSTTIQPKLRSLSREFSPESQGHTHIHQSLNGITTASTLKPATIPIRPAGDLRWAAAASQAVEKEKKLETLSFFQAAATSNTSSTTNSTVPSASNTPVIPTLPLVPAVQKKSTSSSNILTSVVSPGLIPQITPQIPMINGNSAYTLMQEEATSKGQSVPLQASQSGLIEDDYESDYSVEDFEDIADQKLFTAEELDSKSKEVSLLKKIVSEDLELLVLPSGIQDFILSSAMSQNGVYEYKVNSGQQRTICDSCHISRLNDIPATASPPSPLDAYRSTNFWDVTRCGLRKELQNLRKDGVLDFSLILDKFRGLETFSLFYCYYYSITPLEQKIAYALLTERSWKISQSGENWYCRHGLPKFTNEVYEVADFKIFSLDDWAVIDKLNYKLNYANLREPAAPDFDSSQAQAEQFQSDAQVTNSVAV
ncbi:LANO_0B03334g1_1 [Lachancea nothofagi CBS 11611]|uniref:General negative regulator of transcription subunit n=1 Tax=Lachancea nothofagi CBS 11611 TaxID=1266666 RepID=A0A1G4IWT5_9SACH|nr:LANO_0B03334g1_1 [Lachancea nothofagi CBS 11611]